MFQCGNIMLQCCQLGEIKTKKLSNFSSQAEQEKYCMSLIFGIQKKTNSEKQFVGYWLQGLGLGEIGDLIKTILSKGTIQL